MCILYHRTSLRSDVRLTRFRLWAKGEKLGYRKKIKFACDRGARVESKVVRVYGHAG